MSFRHKKLFSWNNTEAHFLRNHSCNAFLGDDSFFCASYTFLATPACLIVVATNIWLKESDLKHLSGRNVGNTFCFIWLSLKWIFFFFFTLSFSVWFHIAALKTLSHPRCFSDSIMNWPRELNKPKINLTRKKWKVHSASILWIMSSWGQLWWNGNGRNTMPKMDLFSGN